MTGRKLLDELDIAVTGASGFIGDRLVGMLGESARPTRVRTLSRRAGAGNVPPVDLADPAAVRVALGGCTTLVHCAFDFADLGANIEIARVLAAECAAAGVRLIHISTAAVYEPFPPGHLDETMCNEHPGSLYKQAKLGIEREILRFVHESGLETVILQPTVVYGPHGRAWTDSPIRELLTGTVVLPDQGGGTCNAVFIDDVCHAIIAAAKLNVQALERILIIKTQTVPRRDFYGAYQEMLGLDAIELGPQEAAVAVVDINAPASAVAGLKRTATRLVGSHVLSQANLALNYARGLMQRRRHVASGAKLALFQSRCDIDIGKARRLLGYEPRFDLTRGMSTTRPYIESRYGGLARLKNRRYSKSPATTGAKADASA